MTFIVPANFRQLPTSWEMAQPFHIDATGAVAFDVDPVAWATNHILALLLTNPGERVMRPTYGVGIFALVWENDNPVVEANVITSINIGLSMYEPNINVVQCQFTQQPQYSGIMNLILHFTVGNAPTVYTTAVNLNGSGVEITA
jgi:phage baseplate assembly protein W